MLFLPRLFYYDQEPPGCLVPRTSSVAFAGQLFLSLYWSCKIFLLLSNYVIIHDTCHHPSQGCTTLLVPTIGISVLVFPFPLHRNKCHCNFSLASHVIWYFLYFGHYKRVLSALIKPWLCSRPYVGLPFCVFPVGGSECHVHSFIYLLIYFRGPHGNYARMHVMDRWKRGRNYATL